MAPVYGWYDTNYYRLANFFQFLVHKFWRCVVSSHAMSSRTQRSLRLPRTIVIITMVAVIWAMSAGRCDASCGDYLVHHDSMKTGAPNGVNGKTELPIESSIPACPCQGHGCSRRSDVPAAPVPVSPEAPSEWACLTEKIRDCDTITNGWSLESELLLVRNSGHRLERPPQIRA